MLAFSKFQQSLRIMKKVHGKEHPTVASGCIILGAFYENQHQYFKSISMFEQAVRIRCKSLGEQHPDFLKSVEKLRACYEKRVSGAPGP